MQLSLNNLTFTYDGADTPVFENLSVTLDTSWRLGLIGRNGRGKTTLVRLLSGELSCPGVPLLPDSPVFPMPVPDPSLPSMDLMCLLCPGTPVWRLEKEARLMGLDTRLLDQVFSTLSPGEQTRLLLSLLFVREEAYPLIDEPTNHLDRKGREQTAAYLRQKGGFLLVSHDRTFLNACIDHVMSLNRSDVWVMQGNYDTWEHRMRIQNESEQARGEVLRRDITRLAESARSAENWSRKTEKGKRHVPPSEAAVLDKGYVGARSAAMMKRSKNIVRRREKELQEKEGLLKNLEHQAELRIASLDAPQDVLVRIRDASLTLGTHPVFSHLSMTLHRGERLALTGPNGCGKTSLLRLIQGHQEGFSGEIHLMSGLITSSIAQSTQGMHGSLAGYIDASGADPTLFLAILRCMGCGRELFGQNLEDMSEGQRKKAAIALSLSTPAHLFIWDEPLNYVDVISRTQLEEAILAGRPTMLLVEHDQTFLDRVCTRTLAMEEFAVLEPHL